MRYNCRFCPYEFYSRSGRSKHEKKHREQNLQPTNQPVVEDEGFNESLPESTVPSVLSQYGTITEERTERMMDLMNYMESRFSVPEICIQHLVEWFQKDESIVRSHLSQYISQNIVETIIPNFSVLASKYRRDQLMKSFFAASPVEYEMDGDKCYRLPLKVATEFLFRNENVVSYVQNTTTRISRNKYCDVIDGSVFQSHPIFSKYTTNSLAYILAMDECMLNNSTNYLMIYCTLGNIPSHLRCRLENIVVLAAYPVSLVDRVGFDFCLEPVVKDFWPFANEPGVVLSTATGERTYFGAVLCIVADHLGAHTYGGFMTAFNIMKRFCRHCYLHRDDWITRDRKNFVPRDPDVHDYYIQAIEEGAYNASLKTALGVTGGTVLSFLPFFHCVRNFPMDLMHTEPEGELRKEMCQFLKWAIDEEELFTLEDLNSQLNYYRTKLQLSSHLPYEITQKYYNEEDSRGLNASQVHVFACLLPLLIHQYIGKDQLEEAHVKSYLKHIEYFEACLEWEYTETDLERLDKLIDEHFDLYTKAYPGSFRPKTHYKFHFVENIRQYGPLVGIHAMRFEAKHQIVKRILYNSNHHNDQSRILSKNVSYSYAKPDQELSYQYNGASSTATASIRLSLNKPSVVVKHITQLTFRDCTYCASNNSYVILDKSVAALNDIYSIDDEIYFQVRLCDEVNPNVLGYRQFIKNNNTPLLLVPFKEIRGKCVTVIDPPNLVLVYKISKLYE